MFRVEKTTNPIRPRATVTPPRKSMSGPSVPVRLVRVSYALLVSAFAGCAVVQVFFAGMGAFGADWSWHTTFVHLLSLLSLAMIPTALFGRLSWGLVLLPFGLVFLIGLQYAFASAAVPAAALHPVNGFLILFLGLFCARRAWAAVTGRREK